jgi:pimeloyl-ACP methyl ester carboxylesterase
MALSAQTKKPSLIYLHGFASGPGSTKAQFFKSKFEQAGIEFALPDLNVPTFEKMTLSAQLQAVAAEAERIGKNGEVILMGSSLGGLLAVMACQIPGQYKITKLILLAPAFSIKRRWREMIGEAAMNDWKKSGARAYFHYACGEELNLDYTFIEDLEGLESENLTVTVPTLIFHGLADASVPIDCSRDFCRANDQYVHLKELDDGHELIASMDAIWLDVEPFLQA